MKVGSYEVSVLEGERFRLDGGAMFGVVPKVLWSRPHPPDDLNRIQMVARCLLVRGEGRVVVVDTGMGDAWTGRERDIYAIENGHRSIAAALAARGVEPADVTDVIFTHLHFDHAGGAVTHGMPAFPRARHHVQRDHLEWALHPTERDRRSFREETFVPLRDAGLLVLAEGPGEVLPGIAVEPTRGHTIGHQVVRIGEGPGSIVFCGDLIPTAAHMPAPWVMSYDLQPVLTMQEKTDLLSRAAAGRWILVMEHDPGHPAVTVGREDDRFVRGETVRFD